MATARKKTVLCDTNIFIKMLRGDIEVTEKFNNLTHERIAINPVVKCELYNGTDDKKDLKEIKLYLKSYKNFHLNEEISKKFQELMETYGFQNRLKVADGLIASTAIVEGLLLWTYNKSDFDFIDEIEFYKP